MICLSIAGTLALPSLIYQGIKRSSFGSLIIKHGKVKAAIDHLSVSFSKNAIVVGNIRVIFGVF